jgi:hypothetical protein
MARANARSLQEIEQLIAGFERSGLSRRQYSDQQNIGVATLDYYRRRYAKQKPLPAQLIEVELRDTQQPGGEPDASGFRLVLSKGRRIEAGWNYSEQHLARLIRIVEAA